MPVSFRLFLKKKQLIPFVFPDFSCYNNPFFESLEQQSPMDRRRKVNLKMFQHSIFSHISKIKHYTVQVYYVIKTGNRLFSSPVYASQPTPVKSRYSHENLF